jgi:hypothetical protein
VWYASKKGEMSGGLMQRAAVASIDGVFGQRYSQIVPVELMQFQVE